MRLLICQSLTSFLVPDTEILLYVYTVYGYYYVGGIDQ